MNDLEKLTLSPDEKGLVMQVLGGVAAGEVQLTQSKNPLSKWLTRRKAASVRRSVFHSGEAEDTPYTVPDSQIGIISQSLEKVIEARRSLPEERRNSEVEQKTEDLASKVRPFSNQLHQR